MNTNLYHAWRFSIKTRVSLITLAVFLAGMWALSFYASHMLRVDMEKLLGEQQFASLSLVADEIDDDMFERIRGLQAIAQGISPSQIKNVSSLQQQLLQSTILDVFFNAGVFVTNIDGIVIADTQLKPSRIGINLSERDFIISTLHQGKTSIGSPVVGKLLKSPIMNICEPLRDAKGKVIAAFCGVTDLGKRNFLDKISSDIYSRSGGYELIVPQKRLIVTATDKLKVMQPLPAAGTNSTLDRLLEGTQQSAVYRRDQNKEMLASYTSIPIAGWGLMLSVPSAEVFAPIRSMQQRMLIAATLLTILIGVLTWWVLRRQLAPMLTAVNKIAAMSSSDAALQPLEISSQDEIGKLIAGFNHLLENLAQREVALKDSESRSREIIDASPVPFAVNDASGNITFLNRAFKETLGYTLSDIPTLEQWWPLAYPDEQYRQWVADSWTKNLESAKQNNAAFSPLEINIHCKDGSVRTFMVSAAAFSGGFTTTHLVILYDITERKAFELALINNAETLKEAQQMAQIGNWTLDLVGGELHWSDEIFRMFEIDASRFAATYEAFLNGIHPDDRDAVNQAYTNSLSTRLPYEITHRLRMNDGRIKWVIEKCMSIFDESGKPLKSSGMVQDITNIKLAELALIAARDEANRANEAKSQFLSSMSHELRTPMNAILGYSQLMNLDNNLSEENKENIKEILAAGYHLMDLITDVLDLSRIESGHLDLSLELVEVTGVIDECMTLIAPLADKNHIQVTRDSVKGGLIRVDRRRFKQVLLNFLSNAVKYNRKDGSVHMEVRHEDENRMRILVIDTGVGISAEHLAEMFQPFNRLGAENGAIEGTGIGLTISRQLIEVLGGTIGVESSVGVGSTFWIELPMESKH